MATQKAPEASTINIAPIRTETVTLAVRGTAPLIINRLAEKAQQQLLLPAPRKTAVEKATTLKHDPIQEFNSSAYILEDPEEATYLGITSASFKKAMMGAAIRLPGAKKTEIAQLVRVEGYLTGVFGIPEVLSAIVRSADMAKTPDVRTRCIIPEWCAVVRLTYVVPILTRTSVVNLLAAAGQINGVGDWRIERGGWCGSFELTDPTKDAAFRQICDSGHRSVQADAMKNPQAYNSETTELLAWYDAEVQRRGRVTPIEKATQKRARKAS